MKKPFYLVLTVLIVFLSVSSCVNSDSSQPKESWLFVHTAEEAQILNSTTIVMPGTGDIFAFTDRPFRKHTYISGEAFASLWLDTIDNNFKADPPNAVLTWLDSEGIKEVEVIIIEARLAGKTITYTINDSTLIKKGAIGHACLFIDSGPRAALGHGNISREN